MNAPVIVTRDADLIEALMPLAAAAGVEPLVTGDLTEALAQWTRASVVLVGPDLAEVLVRCRLTRRDDVYLVTTQPPAAEWFRTALDLQAAGLLEVSRSGSWLTEKLGAQADGPPGVLIGVVGGSGGIGASTFACALARVTARRTPALVVDADPCGPGLDRILGMEEATGVRWTELERTTGRLGGSALREAVPRHEGLGVLTWYAGPQGSLQAFAAREVVSAGVRGHGMVVLDLPRTGGELVTELAARCDRLLVLTRPSVTGVASAARVVARFGPDRCGLVLRETGADHDTVAAAVGAPVLLEMGDHRGLAEAVDLGLGPVRSRRGPLYRACTDLTAELIGEAA